MSNNDVDQVFAVSFHVSFVGRQSVAEVQARVAAILEREYGAAAEHVDVMQAQEIAKNGDFICYDVTRQQFTSERLNGVDPATPWTGHEDHSAEEHL